MKTKPWFVNPDSLIWHRLVKPHGGRGHAKCSPRIKPKAGSTTAEKFDPGDRMLFESERPCRRCRR